MKRTRTEGIKKKLRDREPKSDQGEFLWQTGAEKIAFCFVEKRNKGKEPSLQRLIQKRNKIGEPRVKSLPLRQRGKD